MCLVTDGGCLWYERETERGRKMERRGRKRPNEWKEGRNVRRGAGGRKEEDRRHYIDTGRRKEGKLDSIAKCVCVCLSEITITTSDIIMIKPTKQTHTHLDSNM